MAEPMPADAGLRTAIWSSRAHARSCQADRAAAEVGRPAGQTRRSGRGVRQPQGDEDLRAAGRVPLFDMPLAIDEPDRPLGTHVFTAMSLTDNGAGMRWNLMTVPNDLSLPPSDPREAGRKFEAAQADPSSQASIECSRSAQPHPDAEGGGRAHQRAVDPGLVARRFRRGPRPETGATRDSSSSRASRPLPVEPQSARLLAAGRCCVRRAWMTTCKDGKPRAERPLLPRWRPSRPR